jgi:hypothetical protein
MQIQGVEAAQDLGFMLFRRRMIVAPATHDRVIAIRASREVEINRQHRGEMQGKTRRPTEIVGLV